MGSSGEEANSEGGVWLEEEGFLFVGAGAAEDAVSVGEVAEAIDDLLVALGVAEEGVVAVLDGRGGGGGEALVEFDAAGLELAILGVLEGEIEEAPLDGTESLVVAEFEALEDDLLGLRILSPGLGLAPMDVAGELIEEEDEGHAGLRRGGPAVEDALGSGLGIGSEALDDEAVGLLGSSEPELVAGGIEVPARVVPLAEPKLEDLCRALHGNSFPPILTRRGFECAGRPTFLSPLEGGSASLRAMSGQQRGCFFVFEGLDGSGTTTQAGRLAEQLEAAGRKVLVTAEPSTGPVGVQLRAILGRRLSPTGGGSWDGRALALLFAADRLDHYVGEIEPALERGVDVVCDRYVLSSLAYQGMAAPSAWIRSLNRFVEPPDRTFFLSVRPEVALRRRLGESEAELFETLELQEKIAQGYEQAARDLEWRQRVIHVDGERSVDEVAAEVWSHVEPLLSR